VIGFTLPGSLQWSKLVTGPACFGLLSRRASSRLPDRRPLLGESLAGCGRVWDNVLWMQRLSASRNSGKQPIFVMLQDMRSYVQVGDVGQQVLYARPLSEVIGEQHTRRRCVRAPR
jgi:hypothetical protein